MLRTHHQNPGRFRFATTRWLPASSVSFSQIASRILPTIILAQNLGSPLEHSISLVKYRSFKDFFANVELRMSLNRYEKQT